MEMRQKLASFGGQLRTVRQPGRLEVRYGPVLNVFALDDHIIPPDCSRALGAKIGSTDYTEMPLPGGHVGLFVSSKSQGKLSQSIVDWLLARDANAVSEA
jgi:polyhydroxyalkanoate synthase